MGDIARDPGADTYVAAGSDRPSWATSNRIRNSMVGNRRRDTTLEMAVRRALHATGARYRVDFPIRVPRLVRPDIVFTRTKTAVFLDGCFWHGCPKHGSRPVANRGYWDSKLQRNRERDIEQTAALEAAGWHVLRFWEHEDPKVIVTAIELTVADLRAMPH